MRFLFLGDLVGKPARQAVSIFLSEEREKMGVDVVIANTDNLAHGKGVTRRTLEEIFSFGVDFATCGDHAWDNTQVFDILSAGDLKFVCPANVPEINKEQGVTSSVINGTKVYLINIMGNVFITREAQSPFTAMDEILDDIDDGSIVIVDFHAEATSEKLAMAEYLKGKVSAVLGTHTHVQTADEEILDGGTAYISDAGMTGVKDSILGSDKESVLKHFISGDAFKYKLAEKNEVEVCGVLFDVDENTGKSFNIKRFKKNVKIS